MSRAKTMIKFNTEKLREAMKGKESFSEFAERYGVTRAAISNCEEKYYCEADGCNNEVPPPKMCCNQFDCGCGGKPIEPMVCSEECYFKAYPNMNSENNP